MMILSVVSEYLQAGQKVLLLEQPLWGLVLLVLPVVLAFIMPVTLAIQMYISAAFLRLYRLWHAVPPCPKYDFWRPALYWVSLGWDYFGRLYYGYEVYGLENIPKDKGALIVFYHGALPMDWYLLAARYYLHKGRMMGCVVDKLLFKVPGWTEIMQVFNIQTGTVDSCSQFVGRGELLAVAPGGLREAQYGDDSYPIIWGTRCGFAKVALKAGVPIIPVFTRNIREAYGTLSIGKEYFRDYYERTRFPVAPIYGGLPVKLKTYIGKPIPYDPKMSPEELCAKTKARMEEMIQSYQVRPGSMIRAVMERLPHSKCL